MFTKSVIVALATMLFVSVAYACEGVEFKDATARFTGPNVGSAYISFVSEKNDTLKALTSDCCDAVELHTSAMEDGVMKMRKINMLEVKSGVPVEIQGGTDADAKHLMLIGPHKAYKPGQKLKVVFTFEKAGTHTQLFKVVDMAAKPASHSMDGMGDMPGMHH